MKKIFTLIAIAMMAVGAQAQTYKSDFTDNQVFDATKTNVDAAVTAGWITKSTTATGNQKPGIDPETEEASTSLSKADYYAIKAAGSKSITIYVKGVSKVKVFVKNSNASDLRKLKAKVNDGAEQELKDVSGGTSEMGVLSIEKEENNKIEFCASGDLYLTALKFTTADDLTPALNVSPATLDFATSPLGTSQEKTFTISGKNLAAGATGTISVPNVIGFTVNPTSFTVGTDGKVSQEVKVTYASTEDVAKANTTLSVSVESLSASVAVSYFSRAALIEQTTVSEATTWDWTTLKESIELTETSAPKKTDTFVLANLDYLINFGTFKASDIVISNAVYPSRAGKFQDGTIGFKTSTTGTIVVDFSDTGKSGAAVDRYLYVNGTKTSYSTKRTGSDNDQKTTGEIEIAAGDVTINAMTEDTENPGQMKAAAICVYSVKFTPKDVTNPIPAATGIKAIEAVAVAAPVVKKYVENGQIVIEKAGKKFNVAGAQLK